jgi:3,4-dihydroxy 2-butanone 4-phosphate synthase/GTP cyclohydrolase II
MSQPTEGVQRRQEFRLPAAEGDVRVIRYAASGAGREHLALVWGDIAGQTDVLAAVHRRCLGEEVLGGEASGGGARLKALGQAMGRAGRGVIVYLDAAGLDPDSWCASGEAGPGSCSASPSPSLADDEEQFRLAADILRDLGVSSVRLLSHHPQAGAILARHGLAVSGLIPPEPAPAAHLPEGPALQRLVQAIPAQARRCRQNQGRPLVTLTYAQSLDGSIAARAGHPLAISGPQSQAFTHALRAAHHAILVGIGTVLADNPALTVRLVPGPNPQPVVMDTRLRLPSYAKLLRDGNRPWVATSEGAAVERQHDLERLGARIFRFPESPRGGILLEPLLAKLADLGVESLMVEGGAQVITSFLSARLVDQMVVTVAPILVGGVRVLDPFLPVPLRQFPRLTGVTYHRVGDDLVLWGTPKWR